MKEGRPNVDDCQGSMMGKADLLYYSLNFCVSLKLSKMKRIFCCCLKKLMIKKRNVQK